MSSFLSVLRQFSLVKSKAFPVNKLSIIYVSLFERIIELKNTVKKLFRKLQNEAKLRIFHNGRTDHYFILCVLTLF
jgi:hypothetical protein